MPWSAGGTEKGDFNRWVRATNKMMELVQEHLENLTDWIGTLDAEMSGDRPKTLAEMMNAYYDRRNAGAYSQKAKVNNLKEMSQMLLYLQENNIATLDDARLMVQEYNSAFTGMQNDLKSRGERLKELRKLLTYADTVDKHRPVYGAYRNLRFEKQKAKYKAEHEPELRKYFAARRELEKAYPDLCFVEVFAPASHLAGPVCAEAGGTHGRPLCGEPAEDGHGAGLSG